MVVSAPRLRRASPHWVLVLAAFLFGACAAAALFVGVWRNEAGRAKASDSALVFAQAEVEAASGTLAKTRKALRQAQETARRHAAILAQVPSAGKPVLGEAEKLEAASGRLAADGAALSESVSRLTNAVAALAVYLRETPPGQIDPAYVETQLGYLEQTLGSLRAQSDALAGEAHALAARRQALVKKSAALRRLAEATGS